MHNTEKSPVELGRKHETLFCAWKYSARYYLLFPSSTSSVEPYSWLELMQTLKDFNRLRLDQSLRVQYLFINHILGAIRFFT